MLKFTSLKAMGDRAEGEPPPGYGKNFRAGESWYKLELRWHTGGTFDIYARRKEGQGWSLA